MEQPLNTDNEVSLSSYVLVLIDWWRDIAVGTIAGALLGVAALLALQVLLPRYDAHADVAIIQSGANVAIDEKFGVVTKEESRFYRQQIVGRRAALVGLVHKADLAQAISETLPPSAEYSPSSLLLSISAKLVTVGVAAQHPESDLIRITARMESPQRAKYVADTWAEAYVQDMNQLYEAVPQQVIAKILQERDTVRQQYQDAEATLQQFMIESQIDFLAMRIDTMNTLNDELMHVWKQSTSLRYVEQSNSDADQLRENYAIERTLVDTIRLASSLRDQAAALGGGVSTSVELATALLMNRLYGGTSAVELSFDALTSSGSDVTVAELEALIEAVQLRLTRIEGENETLSQAIDVFLGLAEPDRATSLQSLSENLVRPVEEQPLLTLMHNIEREKQALAAQKQLETSTLADLALERDLRRSTLETLQNEVVELQLRATASPTAVRLASYSVAPSLSAWPSPLLGGLAAVLVAFFGGVCMAYAANATGRRPFLRRAAVQREQA